MSDSTDHVEDLDVGALDAWLRATIGTSTTPVVEKLPGGASNEVFGVDTDGRSLILRRPPLHRSHGTAHDVLREWRFISALHPRGVRVPEPVAACDDAGVLGTPFYVMGRVEGEPIRYSLPRAYRGRAEAHASIGRELVDALAEVHSVDWLEAGLGDIGNPEGFLARQPDRWTRQLDGYRVRDLPHVDEIARWLRENMPPEQPGAIVHGDYKLDNVLYSPGLPPRILAVVDWEMATIGDPLLDVAWALLFWPEEGEDVFALGGLGHEDGLSAAGLPTRADLADRYGRESGRDVSHLDYYTVLAAWKLAIVLEGNYARWVQGKSRNPMHAAFEQLDVQLLERAWAVVERRAR